MGGFWKSVPGILTGIASILAAGATIAGIFVSHGSHPTAVSQGNDPQAVSPTQAVSPAQAVSPTQAASPTWANQANAICAAAVKNGSGYVSSEPFSSELPAAERLANNLQNVDDQLRMLPANGQEQATVTSMIDDWDQTIVALRAAIQDAQNGDNADFQQAASTVSSDSTDVHNLANELGAGTCASGSF